MLNKVFPRRQTLSVNVGELQIGSKHPILVQSMTTTNTLDTASSVAQIESLVKVGCQLVRLTAPSIKDAENLADIKKVLLEKGIKVPLVADIHYTPNAAEVAARIVEKVRINPGNYAGNKKFGNTLYTDKMYEEEKAKIYERFVSLIKICKENGTAIRIGTNHGSLSDRIMERYGDTTQGMVESAMEFLRMARMENFHQIVLSMKSSNPMVMVDAYRLLVQTMYAEDMHYPLHLGVTEAGDGDDGRVKSAMGIGCLLEEGIGDTIRVSLTEDPEFEIPVADKLVQSIVNKNLVDETDSITILTSNEKPSASNEIKKINWPIVVADISSHSQITEQTFMQCGYTYNPSLDKWQQSDQSADYIYIGSHPLPENHPLGCKYIGQITSDNLFASDNKIHPILFSLDEITNYKTESIVFYKTTLASIGKETYEVLNLNTHIILWVESDAQNSSIDWKLKWKYIPIHTPVVYQISNQSKDTELQILDSSRQLGSLFLDNLGSGIAVEVENQSSKALSIAFSILQAARKRVTKTEFISCPSCGRTLFHLQETTANIRSKTGHLKGLKIAIMGCIVNGPGEMADAHYGYVGSGPGKISLYKGKELVKKAIAAESAVDELITLIKENNDWQEPEIH